MAYFQTILSGMDKKISWSIRQLFFTHRNLYYCTGSFFKERATNKKGIKIISKFLTYFFM
ncbi:MAG: hypothetical protein EAZ91_02975 [Cytophagales bacterium]|nr:MAG: hypothetical protein EAZ91_02975 [Cytophagales bacterium]